MHGSGLEMLGGINQQLIFRPGINLRLELVLWSTSLKTAYIIELTVPWEDPVEAVYEYKSCIRQSWQNTVA